MEPSAPNQHHVVRPHLQQDLRDPRYAPIPPSPYSARPPSARPEILHSGDPFLQRQVDVTDHQRATAQARPYQYSDTPQYTISRTGLQEHGEPRRDTYGPLTREKHEQVRQYVGQMSDGRLFSLLIASRQSLCCSLKCDQGSLALAFCILESPSSICT